MENVAYGIPVILLCALGYFFSWRFLKKEQYTRAVMLLMVSGLLLRGYTSADFFLHEWDERYHALVAKNMIDDPLRPVLYDDPVLPYDYSDWTRNHVWVHKQPLPLWTMAGSLWLFGVNEIAVRIPSMLLTTIGIWLTYVIGAWFFGRKVGFLAAFFYSINGLIIEVAAGRVATDHVDIFFLFFTELTVFFSVLFVKKENSVFNWLAGISLGLAILSKWLPALIALPVWILIVMHSGKFSFRQAAGHFALLVVIAVVTFLPWQIYIHAAFPLEARWESLMNYRHLTEELDGRTGPVYYFLNTIRINFGELIYLPLIYFIYRMFRDPRDERYTAFLIWFFIPFIFFSLATTKMQGYLLFTAPALFIMTAAFFFFLDERRKTSRFGWLYILVMILLIALPVRYSIERIKPFTLRDRSPAWVLGLKELKKKNIERGVLFNYDRPVEAMFYTGLTVYREIPDTATISELAGKGYDILVNKDDSVPEVLLDMEEVVPVHLSE